MNGLQNTQRISIAVLVLAFILLIGFMVKKAPQWPFKMTAKEMLKIAPHFEQVTPKMAKGMQFDTTKYVFVDLRSPYLFEKSHVVNALNIPTSFLLDNEYRNVYDQAMSQKKTLILYGQIERESLSPWILLQELGYSNSRVLLGGFNCFNNETIDCVSEKTQFNYAKISTAGKNGTSIQKTKPAPEKKQIPIKRKKKAAAEGGC